MAAAGAADVAALATGPPKSRPPTPAPLETFTAADVTPPVTTPGVATARVVTRRPCTRPGADLPSDRPADSATDAAADARAAPPRPARRTDLAAADRSTDPARPAPVLRASDDTEEASLLSAAATPNACGPANDNPRAKAAAPTRTPLERTDIRRPLPIVGTTSKTAITLQHVRYTRQRHRRNAQELAAELNASFLQRARLHGRPAVIDESGPTRPDARCTYKREHQSCAGAKASTSI